MTRGQKIQYRNVTVTVTIWNVKRGDWCQFKLIFISDVWCLTNGVTSKIKIVVFYQQQRWLYLALPLDLNSAENIKDKLYILDYML